MANLTNMFDPEKLIIEKLETIFHSDMVLNEIELNSLDNDFFTGKSSDVEKVGAAVLHSGFRADPMVGNSRSPQQRLKTLWQVVVLCPTDLYREEGGLKMIEVIQLLKGWRVSPEIGIMQLIDDERGFNRPDFANDLAYLPMMFSVDAMV